jgi:hypothetical protein
MVMDAIKKRDKAEFEDKDVTDYTVTEVVAVKVSVLVVESVSIVVTVMLVVVEAISEIIVVGVVVLNWY